MNYEHKHQSLIVKLTFRFFFIKRHQKKSIAKILKKGKRPKKKRVGMADRWSCSNEHDRKFSTPRVELNELNTTRNYPSPARAE